MSTSDRDFDADDLVTFCVGESVCLYGSTFITLMHVLASGFPVLLRLYSTVRRRFSPLTGYQHSIVECGLALSLFCGSKRKVEPGIKKFKNHSACMSCCFSRIQLSTNFGNGGKQSCPTCPVMVHREVSDGSLVAPSPELTRKCFCLTGGSTQGGLGLYFNE